jgi:hypothetical protein
MRSGGILLACACGRSERRGYCLTILRKATRALSWILVLTGIAVGAWTVAVWQWQDPLTALYAAHRQSELKTEFRRSAAAFVLTLPPKTRANVAARRPPSAMALRRLATAYAAKTPEGHPLGKLVVPRLGLHIIVVNGTNTADLRSGPGRDERTGIPGQRSLERGIDVTSPRSRNLRTLGGGGGALVRDGEPFWGGLR